MKADHRNLLEKAAEKPLTSYRLEQVRYLLEVLHYDIETFASHSETFDYKSTVIKNAINSVREAQKNLRNSWGLLQQAVVANSIGTPNGEFSESEISQTSRWADERILKASEEFQQASTQRASYNGRSKDLYRKAESFVKSLKAME